MPDKKWIYGNKLLFYLAAAVNNVNKTKKTLKKSWTEGNLGLEYVCKCWDNEQNVILPKIINFSPEWSVHSFYSSSYYYLYLSAVCGVPF